MKHAKSFVHIFLCLAYVLEELFILLLTLTSMLYYEMINLFRLVHLDLKGAPPRISYFEKVNLKLIAKNKIYCATSRVKKVVIK